LLYFLCYMPTLALTNSLSFSHLSNPERQFPGIRVLGTIGWIVAGIVVGKFGFAEVNTCFQIGAVAAGLLGVFCLMLPNTPPPKAGSRATVRDVLGLDALGLLRSWPFAVFVASSFLICIPLQFYYGMTNLFLNEIGFNNLTLEPIFGDTFKDPTSKQTFGQISEIFFMLVMPLFFVRLGVKYMLLVGMAAWAARYVLFAYGNPGDDAWMLYVGILLHGICYDFFFVTGYIYVDRKAPNAIRASAQGFIAFITWGVGGYIGTMCFGYAGDYFKTDTGHDWYHFWLVPAAASAVVAVLFALFFHDKVATDEPGKATT
jgi:nucleoside transporter